MAVPVRIVTRQYSLIDGPRFGEFAGALTVAGGPIRSFAAKVRVVAGIKRQMFSQKL